MSGGEIMKFLILFLISLNVFAGHFLPASKIGKDTTGITLERSQEKCQERYSEKCFSLRGIGNHSYNKIKPDTWLKEQSESCLDESDCISKFESLECLSDGFEKIRTAENDEVYCTKFQAKRIIEDSVKKAEVEAKAVKKANRDARKARGAISRQKCKDALDYIAGGNEDSDMTEEQIDQMQIDFAPIFNALKNNRPAKAARLISLNNDPLYAELKEAVLEILE